MSKLDIFQERYEYHVSWFDEDAGDEGAWIGQDHRLPLSVLEQKLATAKAARDFDNYEYLSLEITARSWVKLDGGTDVTAAAHGYQFETSSKAKKFLTAMRAALKTAKVEFESNVPWPEWAKLASAAGWKPPKGWKP